MKCLNTSKATGCDHIPAKLLKPVASTLSHHMSTIFNQCVDTCTFPMGAKPAEVVPLYKKPDNLTMQNYRPVESKQTAITVQGPRENHPTTAASVSRDNSGSADGGLSQGIQLPTRSSTSRVIEDWKLALDDRKHVAAMIMDLSKAFDSFPHELIIAKLKAYGMKEEGCAFVWAYPSKRKQRVKLSGCASDWVELHKGVPRGRSWGRYSSTSS